MKPWLSILGLWFGLQASAHAEEHVWQTVKVAGNTIAYSCQGKGERTVLLLAGMGLDVHASFKNIYHRFERANYQICMYDRAGMGQSRFVKPQVRSLQQLSDEMAAVVKANGWQNLVLVPHSFGGLLARQYVSDHPEQVRGVLFADTVHESWYALMQQAMTKQGWQIMQKIIGWERDSHSHEDFVEAVHAAKSFKFPANLPITVLSRGLPMTNLGPAGMSQRDMDAFNTSWTLAQFQLSLLSSDSRHQKLFYSNHFIDEQDPVTVLEELSLLLARIEQASSR